MFTRGYAIINHYEPLWTINHSYAMFWWTTSIINFSDTPKQSGTFLSDRDESAAWCPSNICCWHCGMAVSWAIQSGDCSLDGAGWVVDKEQITGWWFQRSFIFHFIYIYGMSSFPLTTFIFSRGVGQPPTSWSFGIATAKLGTFKGPRRPTHCGKCVAHPPGEGSG